MKNSEVSLWLSSIADENNSGIVDQHTAQKRRQSRLPSPPAEIDRSQSPKRRRTAGKQSEITPRPPRRPVYAFDGAEELSRSSSGSQPSNPSPSRTMSTLKEFKLARYLPMGYDTAHFDNCPPLPTLKKLSHDLHWIAHGFGLLPHRFKSDVWEYRLCLTPQD